MKRILVLSLVLLLGGSITGMAAKGRFIDGTLYVEGVSTFVGTATFTAVNMVGDLDITGNITQNGTLARLDGSTSARLISAGFTSLESPANRFGANATVYMQIATTAVSGITAITHTGNGITVDWTAPVFTFTNTTSMSTFTPSWVMGFDVGAAMTIAISDTDGITAITHAGNGVTVTWTAPSFNFVGSMALDDTVISTTLQVDGLSSLNGGIAVDTNVFTVDGTTGAVSIAHTTPPDIVLDNTTTLADADSGKFYWRGNDGAADTELDMSMFLDITTITDYKLSFMSDGLGAEVASIDQGGNLQIDGSADIDTDLDVEGTSNLDEVDIDGATQIDGTVTGGVSGTAFTWTWHSDSADDNMVWTDSTACLTLTGIDTTDVLTVADGDVSITDDLHVGGIASFVTVDIDGNVTQVGNYDIIGDTTQTGSITLMGSGGDLTVGDDADIIGDLDVDGITNLDVVDIDDDVDITGDVVQVGDYYITGDTTQTGSHTLTGDIDVDGTANLDVTDIDGTLNVQGVTTHQANVTVANATNAGALFISTYNLVYTQTGSDVTVFTLPANSYVTEVKVMTTTTFDESGTLTCDIGWSGTLEAYASDLDIKTADGWAYADVYTYFGVTTGGSARDILVSIADQNNNGTAGAATVYVEWTLGAPGAL